MRTSENRINIKSAKDRLAQSVATDHVNVQHVFLHSRQPKHMRYHYYLAAAKSVPSHIYRRVNPPQYITHFIDYLIPLL